jgi:transposase
MVDKEDYFMLKDLAREQQLTIGKLNISEISRMTGFDRKTVRHYLSSDVPPESRRRKTGQKK